MARTEGTDCRVGPYGPEGHCGYSRPQHEVQNLWDPEGNKRHTCTEVEAVCGIEKRTIHVYRGDLNRQ